MPTAKAIDFMTMFDNVIFASFIPQILMLGAYLSCLFLPSYVNVEQPKLDYPQAVEFTQSYAGSIASSISYFDAFQLTEVLVEEELCVKPTFFVVKLFFPHYSFRSYRSVLHTSFSRPPPFYC